MLFAAILAYLWQLVRFVAAIRSECREKWNELGKPSLGFAGSQMSVMRTVNYIMQQRYDGLTARAAEIARKVRGLFITCVVLAALTFALGLISAFSQRG